MGLIGLNGKQGKQERGYMPVSSRLLTSVPPLESSSELWLAWGKGKEMAREQGKSIPGSQRDHLRCQLGEWPWETAAASGSCGHGGRSSTWPREDDGQAIQQGDR
jgi:hypothetical protein